MRKDATSIVQDLHAGADPAHRLPVRVVCEYAWHALFIRHLLIRPGGARTRGFVAAAHHHRPAELQGRSRSATARGRRP